MVPKGVWNASPPAKGAPSARVWQLMQSPAMARYLPRCTSAASTASPRLDETKANSNPASEMAAAALVAKTLAANAPARRLRQRNGPPQAGAAVHWRAHIGNPRGLIAHEDVIGIVSVHVAGFFIAVVSPQGIALIDPLLAAVGPRRHIPKSPWLGVRRRKKRMPHFPAVVRAARIGSNITTYRRPRRLTPAQAVASSGLQNVAIAAIQGHAAGRSQHTSLSRRPLNGHTRGHVIAHDSGDVPSPIDANAICISRRQVLDIGIQKPVLIGPLP